MKDKVTFDCKNNNCNKEKENFITRLLANFQ